MTDILLHQYDTSPFSEKVRVCLGIKRLAWAAVDQPVIMPKPELLPLTGGYRRIPVMQIGADIYLDSALIVRELERRFPEPTLFPAGDRGLGAALALWTDRAMFQAVVAVVFGGLGDKVPAAFIRDREALSGRPFDVAAMQAAVPHMTAQLAAQVALIAEQLADGRAFLTGEKPGLADASAYYNLWFIRSAFPPAAAAFEGDPLIAGWMARVKAIGHGERSSLSLFGYAAWGWLLARYPAATVAPMSLLVPVFGMAASAWWLGEDLPLWKLAAGGLILAGLAINILWTRISAMRAAGRTPMAG